MKHDNPDTIALEETPWVTTHMDDVFLPSVRVQLGWREVEAAVERGAVVPQQAHALWAGWASATSGLRVGAAGAPAGWKPPVGEASRFDAGPVAQPSVLQKHAFLLGLLVGTVVGALGVYLSLG